MTANIQPSADIANSNATVWAIVAAAGIGERFSTGRDKLTALLGGRPILVHTLHALLRATSIDGALVVVHPENLSRYEALLAQYPMLLEKPYRLVAGGANRRDSVYRGLEALPENCGIVLVHDAARPLVNPDLVDAGIRRIQSGEPALIMALPVHDTVKESKPTQIQSGQDTTRISPDALQIHQTVDRSRLWRAQTPQFFRKALILQAHQQVPRDITVTDDAQLVELTNLAPVGLLTGESRNLKITTPEDLAIAEALLTLGKTSC